MLTERIGVSLDLFDRQQISISIHTGKHSSFSVCNNRTANRGYLTFACAHYPASHLERSWCKAQRKTQHFLNQTAPKKTKKKHTGISLFLNNRVFYELWLRHCKSQGIFDRLQDISSGGVLKLIQSCGGLVVTQGEGRVQYLHKLPSLWTNAVEVCCLCAVWILCLFIFCNFSTLTAANSLSDFLTGVLFDGIETYRFTLRKKATFH